MNIVDIIARKRDKKELTSEEITYFIKAYTMDEIEDYQAAALLMAVYLNGMSRKETFCLTRAMADSGAHIDLSILPGRKADKHSSGGVGDKTTLIVGPIVSACGVSMAKMSGKGLGHTGGTIDKLEAIPGFQTDMSLDELVGITKQSGLCIAGQTKNLVPADKKLYALRDVTATVSSIPLIASSIMSKKLVSGSDILVLDVKVGKAAFMKDLTSAEELAQLMVDIGEASGIRTCAVLSNMNQPLGRTVGNGIEVAEAIALLQGKLSSKEDLYQLCLTLSAQILVLAEKVQTITEGKLLAEETVCSGKALARLQQCVRLQGGDTAVIKCPEQLSLGTETTEILAAQNGYVQQINGEQIGRAACICGAGREKKEDPVDPAAGIRLLKKRGEPVRKGESLAVLYTNRPETVASAAAQIFSAYTIGTSQPEPEPLVYKIITKNE